MKYSVIDIGSNTVKLVIYDWAEDGAPKTVFFKGRTVGILSYTAEVGGRREMTREGIDLLCRLLLGLRGKIREEERVYAFATASLRGLGNAGEIQNEIAKRTGLSVRILTEREEGEYSLSGLIWEIGEDRDGVMIDMGGGSTEVIRFAKGRTLSFCGIELGCLQLYNRFVEKTLPSIQEKAEILRYVSSLLPSIGFSKDSGGNLYLMGGTARAVGKLARHLDSDTDGYRLSPDCFENLIRFIEQDPRKAKKLFETVIRKRIKTIVPGLLAYGALIGYIRPKTVHISQSGVREGFLRSMIGKTE